MTYTVQAEHECDLPAPRQPDWRQIAYRLEDENARLRDELLAVTGQVAADVADWRRALTAYRVVGQLPVTEANP